MILDSMIFRMKDRWNSTPDKDSLRWNACRFGSEVDAGRTL